MRGYLNVEERYKNDPVFRALVDTIFGLLLSDDMKNFTAGDVRQAAMVACAKYENYSVRPMFIASTGELARDGDDGFGPLIRSDGQS